MAWTEAFAPKASLTTIGRRVAGCRVALLAIRHAATADPGAVGSAPGSVEHFHPWSGAHRRTSAARTTGPSTCSIPITSQH
jgi:hypothetical protein